MPSPTIKHPVYSNELRIKYRVPSSGGSTSNLNLNDYAVEFDPSAVYEAILNINALTEKTGVIASVSPETSELILHSREPIYLSSNDSGQLRVNNIDIFSQSRGRIFLANDTRVTLQVEPNEEHSFAFNLNGVYMFISQPHDPLKFLSWINERAGETGVVAHYDGSPFAGAWGQHNLILERTDGEKGPIQLESVDREHASNGINTPILSIDGANIFGSPGLTAYAPSTVPNVPATTQQLTIDVVQSVGTATALINNQPVVFDSTNLPVTQANINAVFPETGVWAETSFWTGAQLILKSIPGVFIHLEPSSGATLPGAFSIQGTDLFESVEQPAIFTKDILPISFSKIPDYPFWSDYSYRSFNMTISLNDHKISLDVQKPIAELVDAINAVSDKTKVIALSSGYVNDRLPEYSYSTLILVGSDFKLSWDPEQILPNVTQTIFSVGDVDILKSPGITVYPLVSTDLLMRIDFTKSIGKAAVDINGQMPVFDASNLPATVANINAVSKITGVSAIAHDDFLVLQSSEPFALKPYGTLKSGFSVDGQPLFTQVDKQYHLDQKGLTTTKNQAVLPTPTNQKTSSFFLPAAAASVTGPPRDRLLGSENNNVSSSPALIIPAVLAFIQGLMCLAESLKVKAPNQTFKTIEPSNDEQDNQLSKEKQLYTQRT